MDLDSAILYTDDLDRIVKFYVDEIGLEVEFIQPGSFASFIFPNGASLGIKKSEELRARDLPGHQAFFIRCEDIKERANEFKARGYDFFEPYESHEGGEVFAILDPDNNKIGYMKRAS